jgi:hypothetical protein
MTCPYKLRLEGFHPDRIKEALTRIGADCVPGSVVENFLHALYEEARSADYTAAPESVGEVRQDLDLCQLGEADEGVPSGAIYTHIYALRDA